MAKPNHYHRVELKVPIADWERWRGEAKETGLTIADLIRLRMRGLTPAPVKAA